MLHREKALSGSRVVLIAGGTTESAAIYRELISRAHDVHVSTVTDHVGDLYPGIPAEKIHRGPRDRKGFHVLVEREKIELVIDATHPFAVRVSQTLSELAGDLGLPYLRFERERDPDAVQGSIVFDQMEGALAFLSKTKGPVFVTTGVRALPKIVRAIDRDRLLVRVLPSVASISSCREVGLSIGQILAVKGPFSQSFNEAVMRDHKIRWLLTKESGRNGGVGDKIAAARKLGVQIVMIRRPRVADTAFTRMQDLLAAVEGGE